MSVPVAGNLMASNGDVLVSAALAGQGIIYEPTFLVGDHVRGGRLMQIQLDHPPQEIPGIHAVFPETRRVPARVRAFVDFLAAQFGTPPKWDHGLFD